MSSSTTGSFWRNIAYVTYRLATAVGAGTKIHFIDTPIEVIRARLELRNAQLPRFNFRIDLGMLQAFQTLFEVPSEREGAELVVVTS